MLICSENIPLDGVQTSQEMRLLIPVTQESAYAVIITVDVTVV